MILTIEMDGISKAFTLLSILMRVYTILYHDRSYINVMLVLQSSSDSQQILPGSSGDTYAASFDRAYHVGNMTFEEDLVMQEEVEGNVKKEKGIGSEEEECVGIKDEQGIYSEEEEKKDIYTKQEDVDIKEEVSCEDTL
jgi:hypothetical protein